MIKKKRVEKILNEINTHTHDYIERMTSNTIKKHSKLICKLSKN
jgi:hypothetical protein